jgi:hypothetical protein
MNGRTARRDNPKQHSMVGWYAPLQLIRTGFSVAVSTLFGRNSDYRLLEALAAPKDFLPDEPPCRRDEDFWIDYIADLGDGWNSTYAIACAAAQPELTASCADGTTHVTRRGTVLVFGGDQVYPVASRSQYRERLVAPYEAALRETSPPSPLLRVVPGNHDWYDSLVAFTRLFGTREYFAGWRAQQLCSYFAIKLPRGWWLLGTDIQLDSDIDQPQVEYFKNIGRQIRPGNRIILCNAEPHWIYAHIYGKSDTDYNENNLSFLEDVVLKNKIAVFLAGDLHHYRRHESANGTQKITAGGGGAFLHPTHGQEVSMLAGGFQLKQSFPSPSVSRRLCWRNLLFLAWNPWFGIVTGLAYTLTAWSALVDLSSFGIAQFAGALSAVVNAALRQQVAAFWVTMVLLGFWLFTDTHSRAYRIIAGAVHGMTHLFSAFLLGWGVTIVTVKTMCLPFGSTAQALIALLLMVSMGWVAGSFVMGIYLLVSLNIFKRHSDEAFSALRIQDWKNFLRMRIDPQGNLTIFPIGIRRVPRKWRARDQGQGGPDFCPDDPNATRPSLIEPPIVLPRMTSHRKPKELDNEYHSRG